MTPGIAWEAAQREEYEATITGSSLRRHGTVSHACYVDHLVENRWQGWLRARQTSDAEARAVRAEARVRELEAVIAATTLAPHPDTMRLDFAIDKNTTWYPGYCGAQWQNGRVEGTLCHDYDGERIKVKGGNMREAIDIASITLPANTHAFGRPTSIASGSSSR